MRVYISSKMTGLPNYGIDGFDAVKKKLEGLGFIVISPADTAKKYGTNMPRNFYMRKCVEDILKADAVILFGDWKNSKGAVFEITLANELDIPVFEFMGKGKL